MSLTVLATRLRGLDSRRAPFWLYASHLFTIFGLGLSNLLLGLTVLAAPRGAVNLRQSLRKATPLLMPLGFYVLFLMVSVLFSYEPRTSLRSLSDLFSLTPLLLGVVLVRGEKDVRRLVNGLVLVGFVLALTGLAQYFGGLGGLDLEKRIRGPFSHYMTFSGVLLICDVLLLAQLCCGEGWRSRWRWAALVVINLALLGSLTRSAWVGLLVVLTLVIIGRAPRMLAAYVPLALLFIILAPVPVLQRVASITDMRDTSNYDRLCMADAALYMIAERPLFGLGPGVVKKRYPIYRHPTAARLRTPHLHNSYLQLAADRGMTSLLSYLWLTGASLWLAYRSYRREGRLRGSRADLYLGVIMALLAFSFAGLFEDNWSDTEVQRVVLFLMIVPVSLLAEDSAG